MPTGSLTALSLSRVLLTILRWFNLLVGVGLVAFFIATFLYEAPILTFFTKRPESANPTILIMTLRVWALLALPMVLAVQVVLSRLLDIVATVRGGDPFVPDNARRLTTIAWCLLALELLRLAYGAMAAIMNAAGSNIPWRFSTTGWLAVLLAFVLARVFQEGTRLRNDLGAMI